MKTYFRTTEKRVEIIKGMLANGACLKDIANYFGTSKNTIAQTISRFEKTGGSVGKGLCLFKPFKAKKEKNPTNESFVQYPDKRYMADGYCRAIIGEPLLQRCCGCRTPHKSVYCTKHHALFTVPFRTPEVIRK